MSDLERYSPEICSQLRQIAEHRQWRPWDINNAPCDNRRDDRLRQDVLEEVELTYHLHLAAEASGRRAGLPPLPEFPLNIKLREHSLDPAEFILNYLRRHPPHPWNRSDNRAHTFSACA